jgi:Transglutaminase-like superfamily/Coenzyme PQQ synthesis protein D (PqqD)
MHMRETAMSAWPRQPVPSSDGAVVLDLERDRLLKLNPVGVEIWKLLKAGDSEPEIVRKIAKTFRVDEPRVGKDVRALLQQVSDLGISVSTAILQDSSAVTVGDQKQPTFRWYAQDPDHPGPKPKPGLVFCALLTLVGFDFILYFFSFKSLCSWVQKFPTRNRKSSDLNTMGVVCSSVDRACVWYPKKALCLQRSAVTTCLLRFRGIPARLTIGVRPMPFMAHAWVEVNGSIVNDWTTVKSFYPSLASY